MSTKRKSKRANAVVAAVMRSLPPPTVFRIAEYTAVIPHIQNIYAPCKGRYTGWEYGFKYTNGVFEFFTLPTKKQAELHHRRLVEAVAAYWRGRQ